MLRDTSLRGALMVAAIGRTPLAVGNFQRLTNFERVCTGVALSGTTGIRACGSLFIFAMCAHYWEHSIVINPDCAFMESPVFFSIVGLLFAAECIIDKFSHGRMVLEPVQAPLKCLMGALVSMATMPHSYVWWQNLLIVFMDMFVALTYHNISMAYRKGFLDVGEGFGISATKMIVASSLWEDSLALFSCVLSMLYPIVAVVCSGTMWFCMVFNCACCVMYCIGRQKADPYRRGLVRIATNNDEETANLIDKAFDDTSKSLAQTVNKGVADVDKTVKRVDDELTKVTKLGIDAGLKTWEAVDSSGRKNVEAGSKKLKESKKSLQQAELL